MTRDGARQGVRLDPPRLGENTNGLLKVLGCSLPDIQALRDALAVA